MDGYQGVKELEDDTGVQYVEDKPPLFDTPAITTIRVTGYQVKEGTAVSIKALSVKLSS